MEMIDYQPNVKSKLAGEGLYFYAYVSSLIWYFIRQTTFVSYLPARFGTILLVLDIGILFVKSYVFNQYSRKEIIFCQLLMVLAVITAVLTGYNILVLLAMLIIASRNVSFDKIMKVYFVVTLGLVLATVFLTKIDFIKNLVFYRGMIKRQALGTTSPTDFSAMVFYLDLAYAYLRYKYFNILDYAVLGFTAYICDSVADARLDTYCILLLMVSMVIYQWLAFRPYPKLMKWVKQLWVVFPLIAIITVFAGMFFNQNNHLMQAVNKISSNRLLLSREGFDKYGVPILGQHVLEQGNGGLKGDATNWKTTTYFYLDSSYVRIAIIYGLIVFILVILAFTLFSKNQLAQQDVILPVLLTLVAINSVVGPNLMELTKNPFLLMFFAYVSTNELRFKPRGEFLGATDSSYRHLPN